MHEHFYIYTKKEIIQNFEKKHLVFLITCTKKSFNKEN